MLASMIVGNFKRLIASGSKIINVRPICAEWSVPVFADYASKFSRYVEALVWLCAPYCADDNDFVTDFFVALNASLDAILFIACYQPSNKARFSVHI
jgi:hypothetical protein